LGNKKSFFNLSKISKFFKETMEENKEYDNENKGGNTKFVVLIIVIVALLGGVGYLGYTANEQGDQIVQKDETIKVTKDTLSAKIKELEDLTLELQRTTDSLSARGEDVTRLEAEIRKAQGRINAARRGERTAIKEMGNYKKRYDDLLASTKLIIDSLKITIDTLRTQIVTLEKDKLVMGDEISNLKNVNTDLSEKISLAAVLRAENIKIQAFAPKAKVAIPKEPYKAKAIQKLVVAFNLAENGVAKKDSKPVMIRIVEPNGAVLFDNATGGGTFTTSAGRELPYTATEEISFSNSRQMVAFNYVKGSPYKPGKYTVEIYAEGHQIGDAGFTVK
jgi:peptidoglycan hydrolase CwlO-like protein